MNDSPPDEVLSASNMRSRTVASSGARWTGPTVPRLTPSALITRFGKPRTLPTNSTFNQKISAMSTQVATQTASPAARGAGQRGRRGNRGRGARGGRGGAGRAGSVQPEVVNATLVQAAGENTGVAEAVAADAAVPADTEGDEAVCFICAERVKYYSVSQCNHRTCHVCALRLRALYKKLDCTFCKVSSAFRRKCIMLNDVFSRCRSPKHQLCSLRLPMRYGRHTLQKSSRTRIRSLPYSLKRKR